MKLSVVMPAYNSEKTIDKAIESVLSQSSKISEFIVVDDGSKDRTYEIAKKYPIKVIRKRNGGESSALNVGIRHSKGDFIAIVESDVIIPKNWIKRLLAEFENPDVWGVGGILETANTDSLIARLSGYELEWRYKKQKDKYVNHITSANLIYRRVVFERLGMFDENLINSCVDADINNRIIAHGKKLVLRKDVAVKHFWKDNLVSCLKRYWAYSYFRPRLKDSNLYKTDRSLMLEIFLTGFFILSLLLFPIEKLLSVVIFAILFLIQIPTTIKISMQKKDASFLLFPMLAVLRDFVSVIGYSKGKIDFWLRT